MVMTWKGAPAWEGGAVTGEFDFHPRTRILFGLNSIERLGELARELPARRALVVTDSHIVAAGHVARACESLRTADVECVIFHDVHENPTTDDVDSCLAVAKDARIDAIIGLGGGSSLDTAKGCNFLLTNGGRMQDYRGIGKAAKPMLPLIAVPTTAGTGSECQSFALIADAETHQKMACGDPKAAPRIALLDPMLTLSQPQQVSACTGIDSIVHAVESHVTSRRNPLSMLFSREAFRLSAGSIGKVLKAPEAIPARSSMLLGAAYAGMAIENSMLGAAHSAANPLTAHFNVIHGHAVGLMLPHVIRFNAAESDAAQGYRELAAAAGLCGPGDSSEHAVNGIVRLLRDAMQAAGLATTLKQLGIAREDLPLLASEAALQWTARFNPRPVTESDFHALYLSALDGA